MINNILENFKLDIWYKVLIYTGVIIFIVSLFYDIKGISNINAQFLSFGMFLIGLGEFKNHEKVFEYMPANIYTGGAHIISKMIRRNTLVGIMIELMGVTSILIMVGRLLQ